MLLGRLRVAPDRVELRPRRSLKGSDSPELQNSGLRALEEAWMTTSRLRQFSVKFGRRIFLSSLVVFCASVVSRWFEEVSSFRRRRSMEVRGDQSSKTVA